MGHLLLLTIRYEACTSSKQVNDMKNIKFYFNHQDLLQQANSKLLIMHGR